MDDFNQAPKVQKPRFSKLDPYKDTIDEWLESDKPHRILLDNTATIVTRVLKDSV